MATNEWWANEPLERFWMEITDRPDLGDDLRAPKAAANGKPSWSYDLVASTRPGDIVFHWHKTLVGIPALVGWSEVVGPLGEVLVAWTPRATGNRRSVPEPSPNWQQPLGGLHWLDRPVTRFDLAEVRSEILDVLVETESKSGGSAYAPFYNYGGRELRATQGYLVKMPEPLVRLLNSRFGLEVWPALDGGLADGVDSLDGPAPVGGQGYQRDTAKRLAIENHAVDMAMSYYLAMGGLDIRVVGKPYDLAVHLGGDEVRVEVKGSSSLADAVLVTRNEIHHARTFDRVELIVVDDIRWQRGEDGEFRTAGGRLRRWPRWEPDDASLTPMTFSHQLPDTPSS